MRLASSACPSALLILCAPVCVEVLALEKDAHAVPPAARGKPRRLVERRRPPDVVRQQPLELVAETRRRRAPPGSPRSAPRSARRASRARSGRRTRRSSRAHPDRAGRTVGSCRSVSTLVTAFTMLARTRARAFARKRATLSTSFTPGAVLDARRHIHADTAAPPRSPRRRSPASARRPARRAARARAPPRAPSPPTSPVPPRRTGSAASSSSVVSAGHVARRLVDRRRASPTRRTGRSSASAYAGGSSPCSCTARMPVSPTIVADAVRPARSRTRRPSSPSPAAPRRSRAARSGVDVPRAASARTRTRAPSRPARTACSASSTRVMPQILTNIGRHAALRRPDAALRSDRAMAPRRIGIGHEPLADQERAIAGRRQPLEVVARLQAALADADDARAASAPPAGPTRRRPPRASAGCGC